MCIRGHMCDFVCASFIVGLWEGSVLLSHGMCPLSPCGDVRRERYRRVPCSEVAGPLPVCQDWIGLCPVWSSELPLWSLSALTSVSVSFRLCGWCCNRRSLRISSLQQGRCTVWESLWRRPSNMWAKPSCEFHTVNMCPSCSAQIKSTYISTFNINIKVKHITFLSHSPMLCHFLLVLLLLDFIKQTVDFGIFAKKNNVQSLQIWGAVVELVGQLSTNTRKSFSISSFSSAPWSSLIYHLTI